MNEDRPLLRQRLFDESIDHMIKTTGAVSFYDISLLKEAIATTMMEHPEWENK